jgi:hypothetical protein
MDDLKTLQDVWASPAPPPDGARARARAALVARARAPRRHRRRLRLRPVAVGALAAAIGIGFVAVENLGGPGSDSGVPVASAAVLERAADAAEDKPFTPPRDDQWIYVKERFKESDGTRAQTREGWRRADGRAIAFIDERGELAGEHLGRPGKRPGFPPPFEDPEAVAALPADPEALLRWAYEQARNVTGAGLTEHGDVYAILNGVLRDQVLRPQLEAAILRAMKQVPGVTVETVDVLGRPALALGQTEEWLREELLLDPETYAYLGERSTVVRDATISPEKAGNPEGRVTKGSQVVVTRLVRDVVDRPGQRP